MRRSAASFQLRSLTAFKFPLLPHTSGRVGAVDPVRNAGVYAAEHHVQRSSDKLLILGDVVPISPLGEVVSFGDLIGGVGLVDVIVHLMRPAKRRREDEDDEENRLLPLLDSVVHS